jgi:DnaK suppressor protein
MTETELKTLKELIIKTMGQLEESDTYLQEATQPIEPSVALGRLTRMEAIGEKSVNEAMHGEKELRNYSKDLLLSRKINFVSTMQ